VTYESRNEGEQTTDGNIVAPSTSEPVGTIVSRPDRPWEHVVEDPIDVFWEEQDGKIPRQRDPRMCKHGDRAMCDYCMPLEVRLESTVSLV
jgi:hypothetical protein